MRSMKQSVFTTLLEIQDRTVLENDVAFAFLTNIPITPGHMLIAPKRVVATADELSEAELVGIFALAAQVKELLRQSFGAEGFNCAWNEGAEYGQSVPHFHLHIVPRTPGDAGIVSYEPRQFLYRPGSREPSPEAELAAIAKMLQAHTR